jgi:hypothetical protein
MQSGAFRRIDKTIRPPRYNGPPPRRPPRRSRSQTHGALPNRTGRSRLTPNTLPHATKRRRCLATCPHRHGLPQSVSIHDAQPRAGLPSDDAREDLTHECSHERQSGEAPRPCLGTAPWNHALRRMTNASKLGTTSARSEDIPGLSAGGRWARGAFGSRAPTRSNRSALPRQLHVGSSSVLLLCQASL